jgi:hypothetical protein
VMCHSLRSMGWVDLAVMICIKDGLNFGLLDIFATTGLPLLTMLQWHQEV